LVRLAGWVSRGSWGPAQISFLHSSVVRKIALTVSAGRGKDAGKGPVTSGKRSYGSVVVMPVPRAIAS